MLTQDNRISQIAAIQMRGDDEHRLAPAQTVGQAAQEQAADGKAAEPERQMRQRRPIAPGRAPA